MINIFDWTFQIDNKLVRIEFTSPIEKYLQSSIEKFGGILLPVNLKENELIIKFQNNKVANDFISDILTKYPNIFHLNNSWDVCKTSNSLLNFTSICNGTNSIIELSKLINSLLEDCKTISSLTENELFNIEINIDATICCFTFNLNFSSYVEAEEFLKNFNRFKA